MYLLVTVLETGKTNSRPQQIQSLAVSSREEEACKLPHTSFIRILLISFRRVDPNDLITLTLNGPDSLWCLLRILVLTSEFWGDIHTQTLSLNLDSENH